MSPEKIEVGKSYPNDLDKEELERRVKILTEALQNARGLLDNPITRRRWKGHQFYTEVIESIREALELPGDM